MNPGAALFARYAYPPNELGYCGPDGAPTLLQQQVAGLGTEAFVEVASGFDGAWPYLELLAAAEGSEPLDATVVGSYWVGGPLLERAEPAVFEAWLTGRFRAQPGVDWGLVTDLIRAGARPHHSFHVLAVYPWLGLLRAGHEGRPLEVLDRCRIRAGRVVEVEEDSAVVRSEPLTWDGRALGLGEPVQERVTLATEGYRPVGGLGDGDLVALHWAWVCDRLDEEQERALRDITLRHLELVNGVLGAS